MRLALTRRLDPSTVAIQHPTGHWASRHGQLCLRFKNHMVNGRGCRLHSMPAADVHFMRRNMRPRFRHPHPSALVWDVHTCEVILHGRSGRLRRVVRKPCTRREGDHGHREGSPDVENLLTVRVEIALEPKRRPPKKVFVITWALLLTRPHDPDQAGGQSCFKPCTQKP